MFKKKILIIGIKSYLACNLYEKLKISFLTKKVQFNRVSKKLISNYDFVINCSLNKNYISKEYNEKYDNDLKIVKKLTSNQKYIFLSTSKVYGKSNTQITENFFTRPLCIYSKNKLITEKKIQNILFQQNIIILRISNIVGFEIKNKGLKTFTHIMLNSLLKSKTINVPKKNYYKDFITINRFCKILKKIIISKNFFGIYNLSSGYKYSLKFLAKKMINGYGKGNLILSNNIKTYSFVLNNHKLKKKLKIKLYKNEIVNYFTILGKKLKNYE